MKIAIGCDHGGYTLKAPISKMLTDMGYDVLDLGCDGEKVDYPDYGQKVGEAVASGEADRGIVICGTGIGISIAANKVPGVRAALCFNEYMAEKAAEHNNANVLALGARTTGDDLAKSIVKSWLSHDFAGGRHARRVDKITAIEAKYAK